MAGHAIRIQNSEKVERLLDEWDAAIEEYGPPPCKGNAFLFTDYVSSRDPEVKEAKKICRESCNLAGICLELAKARREGWGVWGGECFENGKIKGSSKKRTESTYE